MEKCLRILILEDNPDDAELVQFELEEAGLIFTPKVVVAEEDFIRELQEFSPDLILSDYDLPHYTGALALAEARRRCPDTPFILVTGAVTEDRAIEILTQGAKDYVLKTRLSQRLVPAVKRALEEAEEQRARKQVEAKLREAHKSLEKLVEEKSAALRKTEGLYQSLFDNMLEGFAYCRMIFDQGHPQDFVYLDVNRSFESLTGLKNVIGKRVSEVIPGIRESDKELFEAYGRVALSGKPERFKLYVKSLQMWFSISVFCPEKEYFVVTFDVITERKRAEQALQDSEKRYRRLFESSKDGILILEADTGKVDDVNPFLLQLLGYSYDDLCGKHIWELGVFKDIAASREALKALQDNEYIRYDDLPLETAKGQIIAVEFVSNVYLVDHHKVIQCNIRDITEQKQVKEEKERILSNIQEEKDRLQALINGISDEIWFANTRKQFTLANPSALHEFCMNSDMDAIDIQKFAESLEVYRLDGSARPVEEAPPLRALAGEVVKNQEEIIRTPATGEIRYRQVSSNPIRDASGQVIGSVSVVRDITERKKMEDSLRVSEERFSKAFKNSPNSITITRISDGKIIEGNDSVYDLLGYTHDEVIGKTTFDLGIWADADERVKLIQDLATKGFIRNQEFTLLKKDRTPVIVDLSASLINIDNQQCFLTSFIDITERKQSEAALREHSAQQKVSAAVMAERQRLLDVLEALPAMICLLTPDYHVAFSNRSFCEKFGESHGWHCYEQCFGLSEPCEFCESYRVLETGKPHRWEVKGPDGSVIDAYDLPFTDIDGSPMVLEIDTDITAYRQTEEALNAERQRFKDVLDILPAYVILLTPDYHIIFANRFFETRFGKAEGRRCYEYLFGRTEPCETCETFTVLKTRQRHEWEWTGPDGRDYYIFDFPFTDAGGADFILEMGLDVTENKRTADELAAHRDHLEELVKQRTCQLEAAYKELEGFSYSVSHDLRAPLRAITGYSQMILKKQEEQFDEETRRRFQMITDNAEKMGRLIDDLLAFSRLGSQAVAKTSLDMEELVGEVWQELRNINPGREMILKIDPMPAVCGDRALIRQVYSNLLGNAVKFTQGKKPTVIEVGSFIKDGETVYYIRDNGIGFDMKYYDKLFGVFQRLHHDAEYEGTGIGLALVQRIIHRHGGLVWAEGEVGMGATFYFTLHRKENALTQTET
ncbi:MAG: Adaptive-response sensory-kinase SasA [Syntrophus sp. SKADARSKE-3]|nr:Adaptive-response sensory-kinase SasA [Syntrophus sp. SKADARSKE-3]